MTRIFFLLGLVFSVSACATVEVPDPEAALKPARAASASASGSVPAPRRAADNFIQVVDRVEPVAERICRAEAPGLECDYQIVVDSRRNQPPNAFQTRDRAGRPIIGFTIALIAEARNQDELAFILGHEAAHHIAGHIDRAHEAAKRGALAAGVLAALGGGGEPAVADAVELGAAVGARAHAKEFELEADALGTVIAFRAGFDPAVGAEFFNRIPDPGNVFLGTHPPNAARIETVRRTLKALEN